MASPKIKWTKVNDSGLIPKPRHGHRAVAVRELMVVFGGGNEGIIDDLHAYNTITNQWFSPVVTGDIPTGVAAFGLAADNTRLVFFGGMKEYGHYSKDLYELQLGSYFSTGSISSKWEWKKLRPRPPRFSPSPSARLGHSFTFINGKFYMFGGLSNEVPLEDEENLKFHITTCVKYLHELYVLDFRGNHCFWELPQTYGIPPPSRESHSAVGHTDSLGNPKLLIYGGMSGYRLGDLWVLDINSMTWSQPVVDGPKPLPRSLHSSSVVGDKMYVFGGWVPATTTVKTFEREWKCTNTLARLNLNTFMWEEFEVETPDVHPPPRAGHCAVVVGSRIYVWSGRDGYQREWNVQVCCKDLWFLEVGKPEMGGKVQLVKACTNMLEINWHEVPFCSHYVLQIMKYGVTPTPKTPIKTPKKRKISETNFGVDDFNKAAQPPFAIEPPPPSVAQPLIMKSDVKFPPQLSMPDVLTPPNVPPPSLPQIHETAHPSPPQPILAPKVSLLAQAMSPLSSTPHHPTSLLVSSTPPAVYPKVHVAPKPVVTSGQPIASIPAPKIISSMSLKEQLQPIMTKSQEHIPIQIQNDPGMVVARPSGDQQHPLQESKIVFSSPASSGIPQTPLMKGVPPGATVVKVLTAGTKTTASSSASNVKHLSPQITSAKSFNNGQYDQLSTPSTKHTIIINKSTSKSPGHQQFVVVTSAPTQRLSQPIQTIARSDSLIKSTAGVPPQQVKVDVGNGVTKTLTIQGRTPVSGASQIQLALQKQPSSFKQVKVQVGGKTLTMVMPVVSSGSGTSVTNNKFLLDAAKNKVLTAPTNTLASKMTVRQDPVRIINQVDNATISPTILKIQKSQLPELPPADMPESKDDVDMLQAGESDMPTLKIVAARSCAGDSFPPKIVGQPVTKPMETVDRTGTPDSKPTPSVCLSQPDHKENELPAPPTNIKIAKVPDGAVISWTPPTKGSPPTGYSVTLGMKGGKSGNSSKVEFVNVYNDIRTKTKIAQEHLDRATLNLPRPTIIFRVSAKNEFGYGPATQVRWLQDSKTIKPPSGNANAFLSNDATSTAYRS